MMAQLGKGRTMTHILLVAALLVSFSTSALAAKRYYNRASPDDCRIVNFAPGYAKTTIRKGKRVYITKPTAAQDMAIVCKPEAAWRD
jgi:hypothetical protein